MISLCKLYLVFPSDSPSGNIESLHIGTKDKKFDIQKKEFSMASYARFNGGDATTHNFSKNILIHNDKLDKHMHQVKFSCRPIPAQPLL